MTIGERIKVLREQNNLSQADLGRLIGVTRAAVYAWESDTNTPTAASIQLLARIFHVSTDYLLGLDSKLMLDINDFDPEVQQVILHLVNFLAKHNPPGR